MTDDARRALRTSTPQRYRWWQHVALVAIFVTVSLWQASSRLVAVSGVEWGAFGGMLLAVNLGEYLSHRWHMHVRRFPRAVYHRHVLEHHAFFSHERMGIDD